MTKERFAAAGALAGLLVAIVLLIAASIALLSPEGTSTKVLIAVWLWALPVIGVCTGIGMTAGRILGGGKA